MASCDAHIGIFWRVWDCGAANLVIDRSPFGEAEVYGEYLTHPRGHYDVCEGWRGLGARELARRGLPGAILGHEYEDFPRGRVVADLAGERFAVLADRSLHASPWPMRITDAFGLDSARCVFRTDEHYRTGLVRPCTRSLLYTRTTSGRHVRRKRIALSAVGRRGWAE